VVEDGLRRTRVIQGKLKNVQELPAVTAEIAVAADAEELALESSDAE